MTLGLFGGISSLSSDLEHLMADEDSLTLIGGDDVDRGSG